MDNRNNFWVKFILPKKATKINEIFNVDLTLTTYSSIRRWIFFSNFVVFLENLNFINTSVFTEMVTKKDFLKIINLYICHHTTTQGRPELI